MSFQISERSMRPIWKSVLIRVFMTCILFTFALIHFYDRNRIRQISLSLNPHIVIVGKNEIHRTLIYNIVRLFCLTHDPNFIHDWQPRGNATISISRPSKFTHIYDIYSAVKFEGAPDIIFSSDEQIRWLAPELKSRIVTINVRVNANRLIEKIGLAMKIEISNREVDLIFHQIQKIRSDVNSVYTHVNNFSIGFESNRISSSPTYSLKPKFVMVATLMRTGSSVLYNIARLWMMLGDPNTLAYFQLHHYVNVSYLVQEKNQSLLSKVHEGIVNENLVKNPDVILFSHRKPSEQLCSIAIFGLGKMDCTYQENAQKGLYKWAREIKEARVYDMSYDVWKEDPLRVIREVGDAIGITPILKEDIKWIHKMIEKMRGMDGGHPMNLLHGSHAATETEKREKCHNISIQVSQNCESWNMNGGQYIHE